MSDLEKSRLDLYRRYGVIPTRGDDGSLVMVNTMLSERARKAIANGSRHPLLAHAAAARPQSQPLQPPHPHPHPHHHAQDGKAPLPSSSQPAAFSTVSSSSPLTSPRSPSGDSGHPRRSRSSMVRGDARAGDVRPHHSTMSGAGGVGFGGFGGGGVGGGGGGGVFLHLRHVAGAPRKSWDLSSRSSSSRSHTP